MSSTNASTFEYYRYTPSLAAAIVFIFCFLLTTAFHSFQMIKKRTWYFVPMVIGGCFEWVGYIGRTLSSKQAPNYTLGPYIIQTLLLLVAPALFAASIYMVLGRIISLVGGEAVAPIPKRWLTKIFVFGDCFSFLLQASGGGLMATGAEHYNIGQDIILAGLFVQVIWFGLFVVVAAVFHMRLNRNPTPATRLCGSLWSKYLSVLYATSGLIMIRSIFRVIEYIMGNNGFILRHEIFLYIFDAVPMFLVMVLFNIFHPSKLMEKANEMKMGSLEHGTVLLNDVQMQNVQVEKNRN